jgi:hypothetical protein
VLLFDDEVLSKSGEGDEVGVDGLLVDNHVVWKVALWSRSNWLVLWLTGGELSLQFGIRRAHLSALDIQERISRNRPVVGVRSLSSWSSRIIGLEVIKEAICKGRLRDCQSEGSSGWLKCTFLVCKSPGAVILEGLHLVALSGDNALVNTALDVDIDAGGNCSVNTCSNVKTS